MKRHRTFQPDPSEVSEARRFVASLVPEHVREEAMLVVSELVTNAIEHARTPLTVAVALTGRRLRVEVRDSSAILPAVADLVHDGDRGRGLYIVEELSDTWGVESTSDGKTAWFELTC